VFLYRELPSHNLYTKYMDKRCTFSFDVASQILYSGHGVIKIRISTLSQLFLEINEDGAGGRRRKRKGGATAHVSVDEEERKQEDAPCLRRQRGRRKRESKRGYRPCLRRHGGRESKRMPHVSLDTEEERKQEVLPPMSP